MAAYTQTGRAMALTTPLGKDVLLLVGLTGREAISKLFSFQLDLLATNDATVAFEKLLGEKISVRISLPDGKERYFGGIVQRVSQGKRDETFTHYRIDMAPQFWLWTKKVQSRIFQQLSVPDILKQVFAGLDVTFEIQGTFYPRDYCVQYRESDFDFASRLMEEEGIYYFFTNDANGHKMIVANTPRSHRDVPAQTQVVFEEITGGTRNDMRLTDWEKTQEVRSGKVTLWDHCFELTGNHLEAEKTIQESVAAGKTTHKLNVANNAKLEIYDYPGAYAQRFDGINRGGGNNAGDLKRIFEDNKRTAEIRMQQEALPGLEIRGSGYCRQFASGHKFALQRHFNADGEYVLTSVEHSAKLSGDFRSGQFSEFTYENHFTCIPLALPFRPPSTTAKPTIQGTQTAVVTGPPGEEIFCDKYGRIKAQFFWDRQGKKNADSSCWIRVGQSAAGQGFGALNLPRIGQEVIVAFLEGDPDQPIVVGVVYNAENMPPYTLPHLRHYTGMVHRSVRGVPGNSSEIRFETELGQERLLMHSETDLHQHAENDSHLRVGNDHHAQIGNEFHQTVGKDHHHLVSHNYKLTVGSGGFAWETSGDGGGAAQGSGMGGGDAPAPSYSGSAPPTPQPVNSTDLWKPDTGEAPQDWGIGTFQISASNILTIAKYFDDKLVFGAESLFVVGGNTQIFVPLNVEVDVGKKIEIHIPDHGEIDGTKLIAAEEAVSIMSGLGIVMHGVTGINATSEGSILLTCGSNSILIASFGIILQSGSVQLDISPAGILVNGVTTTWM